jgi:hypothetical protein
MPTSITKTETPEMTPSERMIARARQGTSRGQNSWSVTDIELTLRTVAYCGGNVPQALKILNAHFDKPLNVVTARKWVREMYADRYHEIVMAGLEDIQQREGIRALELAAKAQRATDDLVNRTEKAAKQGKIDAKDLAPAARNLSQVFATAVEKAQSLTGQPTQRVAVDSLPELVNELQTMLGTKPVEVDPEDAEEVP